MPTTALSLSQEGISDLSFGAVPRETYVGQLKSRQSPRGDAEPQDSII